MVRRYYILPFIERRRDKDGKVPIQKSSFSNVDRVVRQFAEAENIDLSFSTYTREMLQNVRQSFRDHNKKAARNYFGRGRLFESPKRLKPVPNSLVNLLSVEQSLNLGGLIMDMERERNKKEIAKIKRNKANGKT